MHFDKRIIEDYDCSYYDDSINMVEREESSNFDSKYSPAAHHREKNQQTKKPKMLFNGIL